MTIFGTSAKFIDAVRKAGLRPRDTHDLSQRAHADLDRLAAGAGEFRFRLRRDQAGPASRLDLRRHRHRLLLRARRADEAGLARRDPGAGPRHGGRRLRRGRAGRSRGEKGELVCTRAVPVDAGRCSGTIPDGAKYRAAYFERFPGIWAHGDFAEWTAHGGIIIHGRSDATLNPGGVRIGTAEIYAQVERHAGSARGARHRPGLRQRRAHRAVRAAGARASRSTTRSSQRIKAQDPRRRLAAPRAGEDRRRRRHPAHQIRQDHRARGARHRARPRR